MTLVSGPLSTVTADPTAVSVVQVSVQGPRTAGSGVQTHESKNVAVSGGVFSHEIAPGAATLTMIVGNQPGPTIPILVDDVESQTLADVVDAARLASGETQESLAQLVQQVLSARSDVLDAVDDLVEEKDVALSAISDARGGALTDIGQATSSAITDIGVAESGALSAIGVEVGKAEAAADRAEDAADRAEAGATSAEADATQTGLDRQAAAQSATSAATHEDTSLDAAAAAIAAAVSVAQFQGHGFPEGVVAAPVGSIYTDLDATNGVIRWIKTSGTGNTGWQVEHSTDTAIRLDTTVGTRIFAGTTMIHGDTGRRHVPTIGSTTPSPGFILRRVGDVVHATAEATASAGAGAYKFADLPAGFRPTIIERLTYSDNSGQPPTKLMVVYPGSIGIQLRNKVEGAPLYISTSWVTNEAWPTILPGTAA